LFARANKNDFLFLVWMTCTGNCAVFNGPFVCLVFIFQHLLFVPASAEAIAATAKSSPVVIVPGDGSNQLEARLHKAEHSPRWYCPKTRDWHRLWLNTVDLLARTDCWAENIKLDVDPKTGYAKNAAGVETRTPAFGSTEAVEELDPSIPAHKSAVFRDLVNKLESEGGLVKNVTLRAAPYDFRFTPDSIPQFGRALKSLIEETVRTAREPVVLVSHSMGGLHTYYFLQNQSAEWKKQFIKSWVAIATPFAGAAKTARLFASGDNEGIGAINPKSLRAEQRSYETNLWLSPWAHTSQGVWDASGVNDGDQDAPPLVEAVGPDGKVLLAFGAQSAGTTEGEKFLQAVDYEAGVLPLRRVSTLLGGKEGGGGLQAPGVPVLCLFSQNVSTPEGFRYGAPSDDLAAVDWAQTPQVLSGDGDGTVNYRSLRVCERWTSGGARVKRFGGISHSQMLMDDKVLNAVLQEVSSSSIPTSSDLADAVLFA
jgi:lysophospholipase-3